MESEGNSSSSNNHSARNQTEIPSSSAYAQASNIVPSLSTKKHAECKCYGSATDEDSDSTDDGVEYIIDEINTSEMDSDAAKEKSRMERYHERKLRRKFDFELANPKIYARTMQEGECNRSKEETLERDSDEEDEERDSEDDEDVSSSSNTSPASSESAD
ncbi:transcriptional regulator ATRX-like [Papaver somniferum]|uniref:transcriptional regulator ATRX-like n=1 Tax=Papaver somniferum TaxID=3469 RepID=UPI000E6F4C6A|nr:transcriptional regulator ATRX-like [Papaver somniferum]